ncbi:MAG: 1-deoxy-D-xylulose-5-phosphate reductoisomerase [Deltaproteobacteria bacterium]|nr:1-deoxy-D-xylulose-5-phosphate reductoisomerase [Deltaproteobacteria bacterium]MBW2218218.1 1-deoxy-D-xylulose-5-phosphate reductoisomerase [Deltaproteobacteria bacterium]
MKNLSILGSTGSIGQNVLEIVSMFPERFSVKGLAAKNNVELIKKQIEKFNPEIVSLFDEQSATRLKKKLSGSTSVEIVYGNSGYCDVAGLDISDTVVSSMVGAAGLLPTIEAVKAGKEIALANKETLVTAGEIVMALAKENNVRIIPIDSEHSAIFQCLSGQRKKDLQKIILTASGGPFIDRPEDTFGLINPADALNHPNWEMGKKISIDSATLMNKGLEVIEARYLFNVPEDKIEVIIHPQSIVHSMVGYQDGSVLAQLGIPDMKQAIAYALSFPERLSIGQPVPDFTTIGSLSFRKPDLKKFPCLAMAFDACREGGTLPAVLNAANEIAVQAFLEKRLLFPEIPDLIRKTMDRHHIDTKPDLNVIMEADRWARQEAENILKKIY